jgi:hypothetical protein
MTRIDHGSPTPPFPPLTNHGRQNHLVDMEGKEKNLPQKIHLRDSWSRMFCNVGGSVSVAIVYGNRISESSTRRIRSHDTWSLVFWEVPRLSLIAKLDYCITQSWRRLPHYMTIWEHSVYHLSLSSRTISMDRASASTSQVPYLIDRSTGEQAKAHRDLYRYMVLV